jgi:tRNA G10  N-methylase Trm11
VSEHPAKFTDSILDVIRPVLHGEANSCGFAALRVLDPFAGTGKIHRLRLPGFIETVGIEIEPEWATLHPDTLVGNALELPFASGSFGAIATSPTYGNRMADHHEAKDDSKRMTYRHRLGRPLNPANSGQLAWGDKYREFHKAAWSECDRVLRPGGLFVVNVKNFVRTRTVKKVRVAEEVDVCQWHLDAITDLGYDLEQAIVVPVRGMRMGSNHASRVSHEMVYALRKDVRK